MTVSYSYEKQKVLQALRYHFINKKDIRYLLFAVNIMAIVSGVLFFMRKIEPTVFLLTSFMWVVLMLVFWLFMPRLIYSRTRSFKDNFITTINDQEIILQTAEGSRTWRFNQFSHWFESPFFFHLYVSANAFFIIPKEVFNQEQITEIRNRFTSQIKH